MTPPNGERPHSASTLDVRALHRALTVLRDRVRLQEDELDRLRELVQTRADDKVLEAGIEARIDAIESRLKEQAVPVLAPEMHALESQLSEQGKILVETFSVIGRTDTNLRRLIAQVDRLLEEASRRNQLAPQAVEVVADTKVQRSPLFTSVPDAEGTENASRFHWKIPLTILALLIAILAAVWYFHVWPGASL